MESRTECAKGSETVEDGGAEEGKAKMKLKGAAHSSTRVPVSTLARRHSGAGQAGGSARTAPARVSVPWRTLLVVSLSVCVSACLGRSSLSHLDRGRMCSGGATSRLQPCS